MSLYTLLILFIFWGPFFISLWPKLSFWKQWRSLLAVFIFVSLPFIVWDVFMTKQGAWGFTPEYAGSVNLFSLPMGELLFFLVVPFVCLVMYEVLLYVDRKPTRSFDIVNRSISGNSQQNQTRLLLVVLSIIILILAFINKSQLYTFTVWLSLVIAFLTTAILNLLIIWQKTFWLYLLVSFAGFLLLNSILTSLPIVWYSPEVISNWRFGSIPVEDFVYNASLLILSLIVWQKWRID